MSEKQKTIKKPVTIQGAGLHTGLEVLLTFKPAPENHGYKFKRTDLEHQPIIDVDVDFVSETARGTTLSQNGAEVLTVEHPIAALAGLGIDNVLIEVNCCETPILDGSSKFYVEALLEAGIVEQEAEKVYFELNSNITFSNPEKKIELIALPSDTFKVSTMIDYESKVLTNQFASISDISEFKNEIAPCRTFVFLHELELLIQKNLVKGGDINNAIVFVDRMVSQNELDRLATFFNRPKIKVLEQGILNNVDLYFNNEPARHKLLDLIGDLALIGMPLKANIIATRPGHKSNIEFAKLIKRQIKEGKQQTIPFYDPAKSPLMDIN
ncbi:MAG: UDP-3-O-acyl-N-acetylglucosamine deacetylase, partial [Bacteroidota bacterium]